MVQGVVIWQQRSQRRKNIHDLFALMSKPIALYQDKDNFSKVILFKLG